MLAPIRARAPGVVSGWAPALPGSFQWLVDSFGRLARSISRQDDDAGPASTEGVGSRLAGGRPLADLTGFVRDNNDRLIRLAGLICRNVDDAEDAVQAAFERAWRNQGALRDQERLKPWLDRIVVREAIRITRSRESVLGRLFGRDEDEVVVEPVDVRAVDAAKVAELKLAYARLSAEQRAVVALHLYAGYSVAETAEIVGAPIETARSRLRLARQRLRMELDPT
ncbi:MAG: sigma-70 family RNA polymerase sigma factor [Chloroflexi bacterium]|nr:sigma-70 family RNA polymerase sigma factor [Chloroflexota bacterium]